MRRLPSSCPPVPFLQHLSPPPSAHVLSLLNVVLFFNAFLCPSRLLFVLFPPLPDLLLLGAVRLTLYTLCTQNQPNETQQQHFTSRLECSVCGGGVGLGSGGKGSQRASGEAHSGRSLGLVCVWPRNAMISHRHEFCHGLSRSRMWGWTDLPGCRGVVAAGSPRKAGGLASLRCGVSLELTEHSVG